MNAYDKAIEWLVSFALALLAIVMLVAIFIFQGCSYHKAVFVDQDGTNFTSTLIVPPFGKLDGDSAKLGYLWEQDGAGSIEVGREATGVDNTGQTAALEIIARYAEAQGALKAENALLKQTLNASRRASK